MAGSGGGRFHLFDGAGNQFLQHFYIHIGDAFEIQTSFACGIFPQFGKRVGKFFEAAHEVGWLPMVAGSRGIAPFDHPLFQVLLLLPAIGPALAAILVTSARDGKAGIYHLLKPLLEWRVGAIWLMIAVITPVLLLMAGKIATEALGLAATTESQGNNVVGMTIATLVMSLFSNTWEEVGWRGFALPRLQKDHNALVATLVVGSLWGLWHLPLFFWTGNPMSNYPFLARTILHGVKECVRANTRIHLTPLRCASRRR